MRHGARGNGPFVWRLLVLALLAVSGCGGTDDEQPTQYPRESGFITFSSDRDGDFEIYTMRPDGSGVTQLTQNAETSASEARDEAPAVSPDGRLIAFASTRDHSPGGMGSYELYVMKADGSSQVRLTRNELPEFAPRWSPDGAKLLFVGCSDAGDGRSCDIETMNRDGTDRRSLTRNDAYETDPSWSPDGSKIAFVRMEAQSHDPHFEIYVMDADGSDERRLTEDDTADGSPVWSPDGSKIAFVSNRAPSARCLFHDCVGYTTELYVMEADGSDAERLTRTPHAETRPAWSPAGREIVFARILDEEQDYDVCIVGADGGPVRCITGDPAWDWAPDWSR
jgi:Tol biopolymer transport system component